MDWKAILWDWRFIIIVVLGAVIYVVFEWGKVKEITISGTLQAKRLAKDAILHSGQEQEDWVVRRFYPLLPTIAKVVISETAFRKLVKFLYDKAKDYLDDGCFNNSIDC